MKNAVRRTFALVALPLVAAIAQDGYRTPPDAITKILDSPAPPVASVSNDRKWLLITTSDVQETTIGELAEPTLFLAGRRFFTNPNYRIDMDGVRSASLKPISGGADIVIPVPDGARLTFPQWNRANTKLAYFTMTPQRMTLQVFDVATKTGKTIAAQNLDGRLSGTPGWSRDGKSYAFNATTRDGEALWVADIDAGVAKRMTPYNINFVAGGCGWTAGSEPLVCLTFPGGRSATEPKRPEEPAGPIVQESYGRATPTRTNVYLLKDQYDIQLFDYYMTSQVVSVALDGRLTPLGEPAVHAQPQASPDGRYLLVRVTHKPYSYQVGQQAFPTRTEVWTPDGRVARMVYDRPLMESQPSMRDATSPGVRSISWRPDEPATLTLVSALDDGDPRKQVAKRDRMSQLKAPFTGEPQTVVETERRYGGLQVYGKVALLSDFSSQQSRSRTWVVDPASPNGGGRLLWDYNPEDRVASPGNLMFGYDAAVDRALPITSADGRYFYLTGPGATRDGKDGDRPYLDRLEIATGKAERLWQSAPPYYETVVALLDNQAKRLIIRRESVNERPDYYTVDVASKKVARLTNLPDPAPFFSSVKAELITYKRPDGTQLSGTLYLPPGYNKDRDGKLPFFLWAYPEEFRSAEAASNVAGSPYQFRRPSRADHLLLLAQGYGVLDNPTMPIVGENGKEPNDTYIPQLVASAKAAIDKLDEMGVGDRNRMGIGGPSYGAFMTGNLLAHSDLFRAGIARSGAYNRTLTPFGFQAEPRTYWQAPDVYDQMSPFRFADKIKEPILLIHGVMDNNQGTFPIQSERMFAALKGNGGNVRYVQLPLESHGYIAKESRRHVVWEMVNWLDTYVKQPKVTP